MTSGILYSTGYIAQNIKKQHIFTNNYNINEAINDEICDDLLVICSFENTYSIDDFVEIIKKSNCNKCVIVSSDEFQNSKIYAEKIASAVPKDKKVYSIHLGDLIGQNLPISSILYKTYWAVPHFLKPSEYENLKEEFAYLSDFYKLGVENKYFLNSAKSVRDTALAEFFINKNLSEFDFEETYEFYPVRNLWRDINLSIMSDKNSVELKSKPINLAQICSEIWGVKIQNATSEISIGKEIKSCFVYGEIHL